MSVLSDPTAGSNSSGDVIRDWLAEEDTKRRLQACIDTTIDKLKHDLELVVPRSEQERSNGFIRWLDYWQERLGPGIQEEFARQFPGIQGRLPPDYMSHLVTEQVWPSIKEFLLSFAVCGLSRAWVSRKIGDAVLLGDPEHRDNKWIVPLRVEKRAGPIGAVILDENGSIDEERSVSRDQALACVSAGA